MTEEAHSVVIDMGTGMVKGGIAGEDAPKSDFPCILGRPSHKLGTEDKEIYIGYEAQEKWEILSLTRPVMQGNVQDWDDVIKVWNHLYYSELKVDPSEQPVHLLEAAQPTKGSRERMMEIMFEDFAVPAFYVSMQAVMSLFASGRTVGLVVDSGEGVTAVVPVYEAYSLGHAIIDNKLAGKDVTDYMGKLLKEVGGAPGPESMPGQIAKLIKEKHAYVASEFGEELKVFENGEGRTTEYTLPDGRTIHLGKQLFRAPEILFKPALIDRDVPSVHVACNNSVMKCDPELRRELFGNVLLSGGTTMLGGFVERLTRELVNVVLPSIKTKVTAPDERKYSSWIGGSILSTLATFQTMWVLRQEYDEVGTQIVQRKCI
jgi:actin, other eukaryote